MEFSSGLVVSPGVATQPWNGVIFPSLESNWDITTGVTSRALKGIPAIGRALAVVEGMAAQMPLECMRGDVVLPRPRLLEQPDPTRERSWFVTAQVDDYLVHGNAVQLVTVRDAAGWPAAVMHVPAEVVTMLVPPAGDGVGVRPSYWAWGRELPFDDVVHVRRGQDSWAPWRGVGVLEQYLDPLGRMVKENAYSSQVLDGSAVPSVAVIAPNPELSSDEAEAAGSAWVDKYGGPVRRPAILPAGTQVVPLAWSPENQQLVEARELSLIDAANMLNMDAFWVGGKAAGLTYKSPGPMYLNLLRQTVGPIVEQFEQAWGQWWLVRGQRLRFKREEVLADDMSTTVGWVLQAVKAGLMTLSEARVRLGFGADVPAELLSRGAALVDLDGGDDGVEGDV